MSQNEKIERTLEFHHMGGGAGALSMIDVDDSASIAYWRPATDDTGALYFGDGTTDMDVRFYLGSSSEYVAMDVGDSALQIKGAAFTMGLTGAPAGDFTLWGTAASSKVWLDVDGDTNGAWYFGANDYGIDVGFYGQTIANSMIWDASANALVFTAGGITMGVTSKLVLPVKASGSATRGDSWLDTTDGLIHYYDLSKEYKCTATAA